MRLDQLTRIRWAVRATLLLGVAVSIVANVLHAIDNPISQSISAWPPLALLLTVELISRVPVHSRALVVGRLATAAIIAGIAAWVSYWHMVGVASRYGEVGLSPYLLPLSVDGLIVVASICLVELGGRIRAAEVPDRPLVYDTDAAEVEPDGTGEVAEANPVDGAAAGRFDYDRPIGPRPAPAQREPRRPRHSAADRVAAAHKAEPAATNERIAARARVSVSSVKRHRPKESPAAAALAAAGGAR